jgi:hypothetical protein
MLAGARSATLERRLVAIPATVGLPRPAAVLALARIETRKLLFHPTFLAAFSLVVLLARGVVGGGQSSGFSVVIAVVGLSVGLLAGTMLAANACALRARRDRMGELFGSLAAPAETRTAAILIAVLAGPVLLSIILLVAVAYPVLHGHADLRPYLTIALLAQFPLTVAAFGAIGVALARWIPHPTTAAVALVAQVMTGVWVIPWIAGGPSGVRMGWHYSYLVVAIVFWTTSALARDRRARAIVAVTGVSLVLMVTSALFQVPPGGLR